MRPRSDDTAAPDPSEKPGGARAPEPAQHRASRQLAHLILVGTAIVAFAASCANGGSRGTAWGDGSFDTNGERIFFTGTSNSGDDIDYDGGPGTGGMMMGGRLTCASCHGTDARGGTHRMHMEVMEAPNIRWVALAGEDDHTDEHEAGEDQHGGTYGFDAFRAGLVDGLHGDGEQLSDDMPQWTMSEADLRDLAEYLQSFETP